jgi:hypothetical protein
MKKYEFNQVISDFLIFMKFIGKNATADDVAVLLRAMKPFVPGFVAKQEQFIIKSRS